MVLNEFLLTSLSKAYSKLKEQKKLLTDADRQRQYALFFNRFGPDVISKLKGMDLLSVLHDHGNKDSLVYWLEFKNDSEFKTREFGGIGGGSALKFGIFRNKKKGSWMTRDASASNYPKEIDVNEALSIANNHKEELIRGIKFLEDLKSDDIKRSYADLQEKMDTHASDVSDSMWGHKYFSLIFPDKLDDFHIGSYQRFHLIKLLQDPPTGAGRYNCAGYFFAIASELKIPIQALTALLNIRNGRPHTYWMLSLNRFDDASKVWERMKAEFFIAAPFPQLGDLSTFNHKLGRKNIRQWFKENTSILPKERRELARHLFSFMKHLESRDVIAVHQDGEVLGVCRDLSEYTFLPYDEIKHQRKVHWLSLDPWICANRSIQSAFLADLAEDNISRIEIERRLVDKYDFNSDRSSSKIKKYKIVNFKGQVAESANIPPVILDPAKYIRHRNPPGPAHLAISSLIKDYLEQKLLLPEIQRSYVWNATKVKNLIDSIYRGYPTGSILIWEPTGQFRTKDAALVDVKQHVFGGRSLLLDGQQRITSLASVMTGSAIRIKENGKLKEKVIQLYFNLDHALDISESQIKEDESVDEIEMDTDGDEEEEDISRMAFHLEHRKILGNPHWVSVTKLFREGIAAVMKFAGIDFNHPNYEVYSHRLTTLFTRKDNYYFPVQVLSDYSYDEVTEVFVRVNSTATRLKGSDLALAQVTCRWQGAMKEFEAFSDEIGTEEFALSEGFLIRCVVAVATGQSRFDNVASVPLEDLKQAWEKTKEGLRYTKDFIRLNAHIDSLTIVPSVYLLIPIMLYSIRKDYKLTNDDVNHLLYWFYQAAMWARYSGSSESKLDEDLASLKTTKSIQTMVANIKQQTGRLELTEDDIKYRGIRARGLFMMSYVVARRKGAKDWGTGLLVNLLGSSKKSVTEFDHIFPQRKLDSHLKTKYDDDQYRKKVINEIANLIFLSKSENYPTKSDKLPSTYLPTILEKQGTKALSDQCVPLEKNLWELDRFEDFLAERRKLLVNSINAYLKSLLSGDFQETDLSTEQLIAKGESEVLEFKSSMRWNYRENCIDKNLESVIAKTVASFLNTFGGTLLVGVDDNGAIIGIAKDVATLQKQNLDGYSLKLTEIMNSFIGPEFRKYVHETYEAIGDHRICVIQVERSLSPAYIEHQGKMEFFVRAGNSSRSLTIKEAHDYIQNHFTSS